MRRWRHGCNSANVEVLAPYDAIQQSYLEVMEDEAEARMEYEGNKESQELKIILKEAKNLHKKDEGMHYDARGNLQM
jgi:hypothetical protein